MKIKTGISLTAIMIAALLAGCGSVSAPPVDLPAPITGRIDVSAPDANGNVTVTGTEGAVEGGELVMVVNETTAASASLFILDLIIPSAYASSYPAICSGVGYACEYAGEDGSFVVVIVADSDDALTIGLIYSDSGEWRSERIEVTVPQSGEPEPDANCTGLGLSGAAVDVKIAPTGQVPVLLKQGSDTTTNQLVIGTSGETVVDITGCYAHSLAISATSTGDLMAVTSEGDKTVWAGRLVSGAMTEARSFTIDYEPMDVIFVGTLSSPIVAVKTSDSVLLQFTSLADGTALETMAIYYPSSTQLTGITRSTKLDVLAMEASGQYLGLALTDKGSPLQSYVTIFRADTLDHYATWERTEITDASSMVDAAFYVPNYEYVIVGILDSALATKYMREYWISVNTSSYLEYSAKLDVISSWDSLYNIWEYYCSVDTPKNLIISNIFASAPLAVMSDALGDVVTLEVAGMTADCTVEGWTAGANIVAIDLNDTLAKMFGADATTGTALDGSALVY